MSRTSTKKKNSPFAKIDSRSVALEAIQQSAIAFVAVGIIQGAVGFFLSPTLLIDAALFIGLGLMLAFLKSRIVALVLLPLSVVMLVTTVMYAAGLSVKGGSNVFVALVVCWAALRAVEATFKLHGRFAHEPTEFSTDELLPPDERKLAEPRFTMLERVLIGLVMLLLLGLVIVVVVGVG